MADASVHVVRLLPGRVAVLSCRHQFRIGALVELPSVGAAAVCPLCVDFRQALGPCEDREEAMAERLREGVDL